MKTETKSKIKKAVKVGAYVGGLLLALVLGMGFGSCSEKKMQDQSSQKSEPKKLSPRFAVSDGVNFLDYATKIGGYYIASTNGTNNYALFWSRFDTYLIPKSLMPAGASFVVTYDGGNWDAIKENFAYSIGTIAHAVSSKALAGVEFSLFDASLVHWVQTVGNSFSSPFYFSLASDAYSSSVSGSGGVFDYFTITSLPSITGVYLAEASFLDDIPSIRDVSYSQTSWFPYQILGQNNSPVIAGPYNGGTMDTIEKGITDVLFSSNGRVFKGVLFSFAPLAQVGSTASQQRHPSTYGYYNQDMTPIGTPQECHSDYLWYLAQVDYIPVDGGPFVYVGGQRIKQFSDYSQSVTQFFDWVDNRFADISIKWAGSKPNTEITTASGLTNLQWLENIASSVFDSSVSLGGGSVDVFSLIGNGFSSITSILSIQILPYLTLGTLLLAPLVILLALAILKVLNK